MNFVSAVVPAVMLLAASSLAGQSPQRPADTGPAMQKMVDWFNRHLAGGPS